MTPTSAATAFFIGRAVACGENATFPLRRRKRVRFTWSYPHKERIACTASASISPSVVLPLL
ncbi:MAG: hypothetical protein WBW89_07215, partial [Candidatus Cybelea sp.]